MHAQILVLGSGPAGYTAALYAGLAGFRTIQLMGILPGGQLIFTHEIENYPGCRSVSGMDLADAFQAQVKQAGVKMIYENAEQVDFRHRPFRVQTGLGTEITADSVIIATGAMARWLQLPGEDQFIGHGVSVCATCDGFFFRGKPVAVIGGGNTAAYEALFLAKTCSKVYLIHTESRLSVEHNMLVKIQKSRKIVSVPNTQAIAFTGEQKLTGVTIRNQKTGRQRELVVAGVFEAVGHIPNSHIFNGQLDIDSNGYILTQPLTLQTSVPGVFACGDIQSPRFRQAIIAAGDGCRAALAAKNYLLQIAD